MAGTKRKSGRSPRKSPSKQAPSSSRFTKRLKPSVEIVEVSSDHDEQPRFRGALRGLDPNNMLPTPMTQRSIERNDKVADHEQAQTAQEARRHMTRGARNGRTDDPIKNNMKIHPMDRVIRPSKFHRLSGSASMSPSALRDEDGETSDASLPSSARSTGDEASDDAEDSDVVEVPARTPDPRASRHSARAEANKNVNYSSKHHPQDGRIPGFQHKERLLPRVGRKGNEERKAVSPEVQIPIKRKRQAKEIVDSDEESEMQLDKSIRPRKRLRVLQDHRSSPKKLAKRDAAAPKAMHSKGPMATVSVATQKMLDKDLQGLLDKLTQPDPPWPSIHSDDGDAVNSLNGMVDAQDPSSSALDLERVRTKQSRPFAGIDTFVSDDEGNPQDAAEDGHGIQDRGVESASRDEEVDAFYVNNDSSQDRDEHENLQDYDRSVQNDLQQQPEVGLNSGHDHGSAAEVNKERSHDGGKASMSKELNYKHLSEDGLTASEEISATSRLDKAPKHATATEQPENSTNSTHDAHHQNYSTGQEVGSVVQLPIARTTSTSSKTFGRSSVRVKSSSSAIKASSRASTRVKSPQPPADLDDDETAILGDEGSRLDQQEADTSVLHLHRLNDTLQGADAEEDDNGTGSDIAPIENQREPDIALEDNAGTLSSPDETENPKSSLKRQDADHSDPGVYQAQADQYTPPFPSFEEDATSGEAKVIKPAQRVENEATASRVAVSNQANALRNKSPTSYQCPKRSSQQHGGTMRPSQRIRKDLISSDPSEGPEEEASDPVSSAHASSPSKYLYEEGLQY